MTDVADVGSTSLEMPCGACSTSPVAVWTPAALLPAEGTPCGPGVDVEKRECTYAYMQPAACVAK